LQTIELTLQFNTPVFARGGSDGFEITPQSIKGIMRFWYRALLPNVIDIHRCGEDTKPYCGMKRAEELLFGSTTQRSLFDVEVEIRGMRQDYGTSGFTPKEFASASSANYAAYGMSPSNPDETVRKYLTPGSQAILTFVFRRGSLTEEMRDFFLYLWGVISMFGGIGAKSRKGYGSFDIEKVKVNTEIVDFPLLNILYRKKLDEIIKFMSSKTLTLLNLLDTENMLLLEKRSFEPVPPFPAITQNCWLHKKVFETTDWKSAIEWLFGGKGRKGERSYYGFFNVYRTVKIKRLRLKNGEDKDGVQVVREIIYGQPPSFPHDQWEVSPTIFGLPLLYQNIGPTKDSTKAHTTGEVNNPTGRKASPLFVSIHKNGNNTLAFLLLIPSQISNLRTKDNKPILTVKPSTQEPEQTVLGNEDFADLKNKLLAAFKVGGNS